MGPGVRHGIAQAAQAQVALGLLVLAACLFAGCGADEEQARARAASRLHAGGQVIARDLETRIAACEQALEELPAALDAAGEDETTRWQALDTLRQEHGVTGLLWEGPDNARVWAGRPIQPHGLPAARPWERSFGTDPDEYYRLHAGPFVRAVVVGPQTAAGGRATATWLLEEIGPAQVADAPFTARWLEPLDLLEVTLRHPSAPEDADCEGACHRRVDVRAPDGRVVMVADLRVHDLDVLRERIEIERAGIVGAVALLLLLLVTIGVVHALRRRVRDPMWRWLGLGAWVLVARGALKLVDLPARFPALREAFAPTEFAVETLLGWLASPGDFALTASTYLLCTICVTYAFRHLQVPRRPLWRAVTLLLALATTCVAISVWLYTVDAAVGGGQTPFFQANTFVPSAPPALMLFALVATTATTYLVTHIVLRRGLRALPGRAPGIRRVVLLLLALLAVAAALALWVRPHWVAYALVATAALLVGRAEGRFALALPGRVLVLSVLAVAFAYPVLWTRVEERARDALGDTLDELLGSEDNAKAGVAAALVDARSDPRLAAAVREVVRGGRPDGLALDLWLRHAGQWQRSPSVVTILDELGRPLEKFSLTTLPRKLLPVASRPSGEEDEEVFVRAGSAVDLRCIVGRLRVRDEAGEVVGHLVIHVPDPMALRLRGLAGLAAATDEARPMPLTAGRRPQLAALKGGAVIASSDPSLSRAAGSFGPPALAAVDATNPMLHWEHAGVQGVARWSDARRGTFAIRREAASLGGALLALARVVVVGVGLGLLASVVCFFFTLRSFQFQLQHKILLSYFVMSVVPLVLLGVASARETQARYDGRLTERLQTDLARVRSELELLGSGVFDAADSDQLEDWAPQRRHDTLLYRDGRLEAASRTGLVDAELLSAWLPTDAYRATVLEQRQLVWREAVYAGRGVWYGYAPILDTFGRTRATVGVPLLYDADRIEEQQTLTGSVLLAAYMLTLVLVLVGGLFAARRLTRPLGDLVLATERVAAGDLDVEALPGSGGDEIGQLVGAFNTMTGELREMTGRLAAAERESAWRRMASQVAHEIKNPLTPMRLLLQQMQADLARNPDKAEASIRMMAPKVLAQIESLDRIARDFAHFARLPQRRSDEVDVGQLVRDVTDLYVGASLEGITVRCEIVEPLPPVWWDEEELRRVLLNMVLNAKEALDDRPSGEVLLRATAETQDDRLGVLVTIADDGVGIDPADADRLFEPQFSTKTRGTGLGLAIVSRIVQDLGGTIDFESQPQAGTTFRLWWPSVPPTNA
ncbi:MAG: ATP-binding protein [Planctomycetota bacterium]|nr:ATP-binding protein [Planctomycetota bacterium]